MKLTSRQKLHQAIRRVQIVQGCLQDEIMPRLVEDFPKPRSDRQRATYRCLLNFVSNLVEGNEKFLMESRDW